MFILLPPSEGKVFPADADPMDFGSLALPVLGDARRSTVSALAELCAGPAEVAASVLGLSEGQRGELDHNRDLLKAPAAPAAQLYRGVLYDALGLAELHEARDAESVTLYQTAQERLLIFSGLWGVLRPDDRIPRYRCSAGVKLPGVGAVSALWRRELAGPLAELAGDRLVVDLRSSAYAGMWKPRGNPERTVAVRVLHERSVGGTVQRTIVSHFNKATKGRLTLALLRSGETPDTPDRFAELLRELGFTAEQPGPGAIDLVVREL
jgi:uncharacterized protein